MDRNLARFACAWLLLGLTLPALGQGGGGAAPASADSGLARQFESKVAPLLMKHCLECHGASSKRGRLDLSRKEAAFAGGENGAAIVPGKPDESLLWLYVESDEMPKGRKPLSDSEKQRLRQWIEAGAVWSVEAIGEAAARDRGVAENWLRRLTVDEYIETVRSAVGIDIQRDARRQLPPDLRADGFSNTAYNLQVDLSHIEAYARLAQIIAARLDAAAFAAQFSQRRELNDAAMRELIGGMGKWLLRGPLEEHEIAAFLRISRAVAAEGGNYDETVRLLVEAMLQSPRFLYCIERQTGADGSPQLDGYSLASRLSYILWGGPPDRELMRAAEAGELSDRNRIERHVQRMLQDPRAIRRSSRFLYDWIYLERMNHLRPDPQQFPGWNDRLAADMLDETLAFFEEVAWNQKRPMADLLKAQVTFVTPRLAAHYGLPGSKLVGVGATPSTSGADQNAASGLVALYSFDEGSGATVRDTSGAGESLDLSIENPAAVVWADDGLRVRAPTVIGAAKPPTRLVTAVKKSNAITLEAWITPADTAQNGPARILTLSSGTGARNFTLGQDGNTFDVRLRTTRTDANGLPSLASRRNSATTNRTHVVLTRNAAGRARLYVHGQEHASREVGGNLSNWDGGFRLTLANESSKDRPWRGILHQVAIYDRALDSDEVLARSKAGVTGSGPVRYDLSSVPGRGGLLTHGSTLTIGGDEASMVTRGLFILNELLYSGVENPPPCADTTPVPTKPGQSQRAIALQRINNQACNSCHSKFEPLAFGLEKFDGLGAYHEQDEHGNQLREDGEIHFPDEEQPVAYRSSAELMELLAASPRVKMGITRKVAQFALGRPLVEADMPWIDRIHQESQDRGGTYAAIITAVVMSDLVLKPDLNSSP
jgi:hypothetical protein